MEITGAQIKRLMRANKVTIRGLSARMNIPMVRVREVRNSGLHAGTCRGEARQVGAFALDWFEAITGSTQGFGSWFSISA